MPTENSPEPLSTILDRFNKKFGQPDQSGNQQLDTKATTNPIVEFPFFDEDQELDEDDEYFSKPVNSAFDINIAEFPIAYLNRGKLPKMQIKP